MHIGLGKQFSDTLHTPLQMFSPTDPYTCRDAFEGTFITGSPGAGKSANVAKNWIYSALNAGWGGLVLIAKAEETRNWIDYAKACGRTDDLIIFNAESGHSFDPLFYAWNREGRGQGDLETIIDLFSTLQAIGKQHVGHGEDPYWERGCEQIIRNVIKLIDLAQEPLSIVNIDRAIRSMPTTPGEQETEIWQNTSYCASLINKIRARKDSLTKEQWSDLDFATHYVFSQWPALDERPRGSLLMMWSSIADKFVFNPFNRIFSSGRCTFLPEMTTHQGKIVIVDFPILEYGYSTGQLINVLIKLIFQAAWLRRDITKAPNGVFLVADECQYFIHRRDNSFQQTARGFRIATCYITQNLLNLSEELGEHTPGSKTKSFLGNLALKIFCQQNDTETNNYAADLIGKEWRFVDSFHANAGNSSQGQQSGTASVGGARQLVYRVEPAEFSRLTKPDGNNPLAETIIYFGGKTFNATVTDRNPEGRNYLRLFFSRDISQ